MKVALTIAGSDSSGGAGLQADLKTFEAFGVFGASALTVLTAQNTTGVRAIEPVPPAFVEAQIRAVLDDFDVGALKIGMLYDTPIIETVRKLISGLDIPIVLDPVFISKAGSSLLKPDAVDALKSLFEHVTLITPNRYEAKALFGYEHGDTDALADIMAAPCPVLVKHQVVELPDVRRSVDQLYSGHHKLIFQSELIDTTNLHGTGCSYSSAIAANLALGHPLDEAIAIAKRFITEALRHAPAVGHGPGPVNHKAGGIHVA